jgi:hypothetical protein
MPGWQLRQPGTRSAGYRQRIRRPTTALLTSGRGGRMDLLVARVQGATIVDQQ